MTSKHISLVEAQIIIAQNTEHSRKQGPLDQEGTSGAKVESDERGKMSSNNNGYGLCYIIVPTLNVIFLCIILRVRHCNANI